jgi:hypothetical protein
VALTSALVMCAVALLSSPLLPSSPVSGLDRNRPGVFPRHVVEWPAGARHRFHDCACPGPEHPAVPALAGGWAGSVISRRSFEAIVAGGVFATPRARETQPARKE